MHFLLLLLFFAAGCQAQAPQEVRLAQAPSRSVEKPRQTPALTAVRKAVQRHERLCRYGVCFDSVKEVDGQIFELRGVSMRKHLWFDVYAAAFYLPPGNIAYRHGVPAGPKMIILDYRRTIEKAKVVQSIIDNVRRNPDVDADAVEERFNRLADAFDPPHKDSRYEFVYIPDRDFRMISGGEEKVSIPGDDFAFAFFGMWLSEHEKNQHMRQELMGKPGGAEAPSAGTPAP